MDQMPVDIDEAGAVILLMHQVIFPDLVEQRFRHVPVRDDAPGSRSDSLFCRRPCIPARNAGMLSGTR
jgi:hypothetical protein